MISNPAAHDPGAGLSWLVDAYDRFFDGGRRIPGAGLCIVYCVCVCACFGPCASDLAPRSLIPAKAYIPKSPAGDDQAKDEKKDDHKDLDHEQGHNDHLEGCVVLCCVVLFGLSRWIVCWSGGSAGGPSCVVRC